MRLSSFIGETGSSELLAAYRGRYAIARPERVAERFAALWAEWELEAICRFTVLPESDTFRLVTHGKQVPPPTYRGRPAAALHAAVQQFRQSGATVNFPRVEAYSNTVLALVREIERAFDCHVRVHFFSTPPRAQGLGLHADHGDALILQVQGSKTWDVYHGSDRWPAAEVPAKLKSEPPDTFTLETGSWLFVPAGVYHEVRNRGDEPSTHFTIGFHPLSWAAGIESAVQRARQASPAWREPLSVLGGAPAAAEVARRLEMLPAFLAEAMAVERYGVPLPDGEVVARERLESIDRDTRLAWRGDAVTCDARPDRCDLSLAYRSVPLRLRPELADVLRRMGAASGFTPGELALPEAESVLLCRFLAHVGVVQFAAKR